MGFAFTASCASDTEVNQCLWHDTNFLFSQVFFLKSRVLMFLISGSEASCHPHRVVLLLQKPGFL